MKTPTWTKALVIAISVGVSLLCVTVYSSVYFEAADLLFIGTISDSQVFNGPATVSTRALTLKPGEKLPWHYHPGSAFNVVKSGTLSVEDGCGGVKTLKPGQGFEEMDGRVHHGMNLSESDVIVYDTSCTGGKTFNRANSQLLTSMWSTTGCPGMRERQLAQI